MNKITTKQLFLRYSGPLDEETHDVNKNVHSSIP